MGRNKFKKGSGKFIQLEHWIYDSPAYQSLKPGPRAIYMELKRKFNGYNNGNIYLSQRVAGKAANVDRGTAGKYLVELVAKGFIVKTKGHYLGPEGVGKAVVWALTELPIDGKPATKEFMKWKK